MLIRQYKSRITATSDPISFFLSIKQFPHLQIPFLFRVCTSALCFPTHGLRSRSSRRTKTRYQPHTNVNNRNEVPAVHYNEARELSASIIVCSTSVHAYSPSLAR